MKEKVVSFRKTQQSLALCVWFSSPPLFRNSIARGGSLFRISRVSGKLRRKRHNVVTPFATIFNRGERRVMRTTAVRCARAAN